MICRKCGSEEYTTEKKGLHLRANCAKCGSYIKFIAQPLGDINWETQIIYFGKHKGKLFKDIAKESPSYIRWMAENLDKKMKEIAEEAIFEFKI